MLSHLTLVESAWLIITFISLAIAAYFDYKSRIIPDKIWIFQIGSSVIVWILWYQQEPNQILIISAVINILIAIIFSLVLIFTATMGGGDIKAFFSTSISFPFLVNLFQNPLFGSYNTLPAIMSLLLNFWTCFIILSLLIFSYNLITLKKHNFVFRSIESSLKDEIRVMFEGINIETTNIEKREFYNPLEVYKEGKWHLEVPKFDGLLEDEEFEKIEKEEREEMIRNVHLTDKSRIWIRPQIPGLVILFISFLMTITVGTIFGQLFEKLTTLL